MNDTTASKARGQARLITCAECGRQQRHQGCGLCSRCYNGQRRKEQVGTCVVCGKENAVLRSKGRCPACEVSHPMLGEDRRQRSELTAEQVAAGVARREDYLMHLYPVVRRVAWRRGRHLPYHLREERVADAVALSWRTFCQLVAAGKDPLPIAADVAIQCVYRAREGRTVLGHRGSEDPLSPLFHRFHPEAKLSRGDVVKVVRARQVEEEEAEVREWLRGLPEHLAEIAEYISVGNSWADAMVRFTLDRHEKDRIVKALQASWNGYSDE